MSEWTDEAATNEYEDDDFDSSSSSSDDEESQMFFAVTQDTSIDFQAAPKNLQSQSSNKKKLHLSSGGLGKKKKATTSNDSKEGDDDDDGNMFTKMFNIFDMNDDEDENADNEEEEEETGAMSFGVVTETKLQAGSRGSVKPTRPSLSSKSVAVEVQEDTWKQKSIARRAERQKKNGPTSTKKEDEETPMTFGQTIQGASETKGEGRNEDESDINVDFSDFMSTVNEPFVGDSTKNSVL